MYGLYSYAKTTMTYDAVVKTSVPTTIMHLLSQRKRWNLGTVTHNIWMAFAV
jgi:cellulose synthase/poly-beta-1,6-N-acetylglucosamine synthase-like glycosyltransferase